MLLTHRWSTYRGWTIVAALGITTIVSYGTTVYAFGVLLTPIASDQSWARGALSGAYALGILVAGVLGVPIGRAVDRFGARVLMSVGSALGGIVLLALSQVHQVEVFVVLWGLGLGFATALTFYPVSFTVVANWFERRRGMALAWLTTIGGLASPLFIPAIGWSVVRFGWRETLILLGLAQLVVALPLHALVLRRQPEDLGLLPDGNDAVDRPDATLPRKDRPTNGMSAWQAIRSTPFWGLTAAGGIDQLAAMIVSGHQIAFMITRGFDPIFAADVAGLIGLVSLPGRFVLNQLGDRYNPQRLLSLVLAILGFGLVVLILARSPFGLYLYVVVFGIVFGVRSPLRARVMAEHFGRQSYGTITALQGVVMAVPAAFGPLAAGWLYDLLGNYQLAFWLTMAAFIVASLLTRLTPHPGSQK